MMKIGIIRDKVFAESPRILNMATFLSKEGFEIFVLCYGKETEKNEYDNIVLERFFLNKILKDKLFPFIEIIPIYKFIWKRKIINFIKTYKIDVLQVSDLYMLGAAIKANKRFNLPIIVNYHENYVYAVNTYSWATTLIGRLVVKLSRWSYQELKYLKKVNKIIVLSEGFKQELLFKYKFLDKKNIIVYPNVPDIEMFSNYKVKRDLFYKKGSFIIFYFGIIAERRGIITLLNTARLLSDLPIKFLLIGKIDKAEKRKFKKLFSEIKERIIYYPWIDIKDLPSYVVKADICISPILRNPQHDSGVANKLFQYMLFGKPVIVSDSTEQRNVVNESKCGLIFKYGNEYDLSSKIYELYSNRELRNTVGKNGRRAVYKKYNTEIQKKEVIKMYKEFCRCPRCNGRKSISFAVDSDGIIEDIEPCRLCN